MTDPFDATARSALRTPGALQGIVLLLPITLAVMGISVLVPVLPQIMEQFKDVPNHAYLVQGGILTMPALCILLFSGPAGWVADKFGRRQVLIAAMVIYSLVGMAPMVLNNIYAIIASRVGVGICEAIAVTVSTTLISDYFKGAERQKWLASQAAVGALSSLVLIAFSGIVGSKFGWHGVFAVYGFSLPLAAALAAFTWEPTANEGTAEIAVEAQTPGIAPGAFPWTRLLGICAISLVASVMFYTIQTQSALALNLLGVHDPASLGLCTAIATLGVPIGTFVFSRASRLPVASLLLIEFLLIGVGFVGMGHAHNPKQYVALAFLNQIGCGMILPTLLTWATAGLAFEIRGRGNGMWQATFAIGQFLSGLTITLLAESLGGLLPALVALGSTSIVVAMISGGALIRWRGGIAARAEDA